MPDPFPNELVEAAAQALFDEWCHLSGEPLGEWRESGEPAVWDLYAKRTLAVVVPFIVEALRDQADMLDPSDCLPPEDHYPTFRGWQGAAQFIERTFLSPDNPEGNA